MLQVTTITADLFTCMAVQSSLHNSWLRPSPACRDRHPLPGTSCAACRHWCLQISLPSFPDWAHTAPVVHWGVPESQGTVTTRRSRRRRLQQKVNYLIGKKRTQRKTSGQGNWRGKILQQRRKDMLEVFCPSELFNDISGIMEHGSHFLWLWWWTQLIGLHFLFILKKDKFRQEEEQQQQRGGCLFKCESKWLQSCTVTSLPTLYQISWQYEQLQ